MRKIIFISLLALLCVFITVKATSKPQVAGDFYIVHYAASNTGNFTIFTPADSPLYGFTQTSPTAVPQIWLSYDRTETKITRTFVGLRTGDEVPVGAKFVGFVANTTGSTAVFEVF